MLIKEDLIYLTFFCFFPSPLLGFDTQINLSQGFCSISGQVTVEDRPANGVTICAARANSIQGRPPYDLPEAVAVTDSEGKYRLTGLRAGSFEIKPLNLGYIINSEDPSRDIFNKIDPTRIVNLAEGEEVNGVDFSLSIGGVITGRITLQDGRPLVEKRVRVTPAGREEELILFPMNSMTDDRGIYRLYGVPSGSYIVSVGELGNTNANMSILSSGFPMARTFYPGTRVESQATPVEVREGDEVSGIDFKISNATKGYSVSGTIVSADSRTPLPEVKIILRRLDQAGKTGGALLDGGMSNINGEFTCSGLFPGEYELTFFPSSNLPFYGDPLALEVSDADITGLVVELQKGNSRISGAVVLEGVSDPSSYIRIHPIKLWASISRAGMSVSSPKIATVDGDGTFLLDGLPGGTAGIFMDDQVASGLFMRQVEVNGVPSPNNIYLIENETVSGVKVILTAETGSIHGQIRTKEGIFPPEVECSVGVRPLNGISIGANSDTDPRGQFRIDQLPPGEYEITVYPFLTPTTRDSQKGRQLRPVAMKVNVNAGQVSQPVILIDLNAVAEEESK